MRSGPQEPTERPLVLPTTAPTPQPAKINTPPKSVSEFERGNIMPDGLRERRPAPTSDAPGSICSESEFGMLGLYSRGVPRESLPQAIDRDRRALEADELLYMPSPKWDWGMAE